MVGGAIGIKRAIANEPAKKTASAQQLLTTRLLRAHDTKDEKNKLRAWRMDVRATRESSPQKNQHFPP